VRTVFIDDAELSVALMADRFAELEREASAEFTRAREGVQFRRSVAVRYRGQSHELDVVLSDREMDEGALSRLRAEFYRRHREAFGVGSTGPIEIVNLRVRATVTVPHARFARTSGPTGERTTPTRPAWFDEIGGFVATPVHQLAEEESGTVVPGPALIEAPESTILVPPTWQATVEPTGAVLLSRAHARGRATS
jgi:N-methylhydantoinase A